MINLQWKAWEWAARGRTMAAILLYRVAVTVWRRDRFVGIYGNAMIACRAISRLK
ncbi:hypothetical protein [Janthinobacterium sp. PSPC3-1]|jgi:hypothetical protein|uniref:hypothetical protein n=1 Tax=Janthinobacterium sp. PSPC3-1 TaxID=2804653 RepID=UPI003CE6B426